MQFLIGIDFLHTSLDIAHAYLHSQNILIKKPVMQPDVNFLLQIHIGLHHGLLNQDVLGMEVCMSNVQRCVQEINPN